MAARLLVDEFNAQRAREQEERKRQEDRAAALAAAALAASNAVSATDKKGGELDAGAFIMPRRIAQNYSEVDGRLYTKDGNRLMFQDQGDKLATSTTDKAAIADMVALAKAKQWSTLKLAGSVEFRREAWLQAESQGLKTQGYTPKEADIAALKALTNERSTNLILPVSERTAAREAPTVAAPRSDMGKHQAALAAGAIKNRAAHHEELRTKPGFDRLSAEELGKVAFYRALLVEREADKSPELQSAALAEFDKAMTDPAKVRELPEPALQIQDRAEDRSKVDEARKDQAKEAEADLLER